MKRQSCLLVNTQRAGSSSMLLRLLPAINAAQPCGDVERRDGIADCKTVLEFDARMKLSLYWIIIEDLRAGSSPKSVG